MTAADSAVAPKARFMPSSGQAAPAPSGYVSFCLRFADQCTASAGAADTVTLTPDVWQKLLAVNATVNNSIWSQDDSRHYGRAEYWTIPTDGYGDCEDIALTKRQQLIAAGLPEQALRIAVAITPRQINHAVLTVATSSGDYVLDNLTRAVQSWDQSDYRWIKRQDPVQGWVSVVTAPQLLALADANVPLGATIK